MVSESKDMLTWMGEEKGQRSQLGQAPNGQSWNSLRNQINSNDTGL